MENIHWNQALDLGKQQKWAEAIPLYQSALRELPENPDLLHDHGVCLFQLGRGFEAMNELNKAVLYQPEYSYRYSSRAWIKVALKDYNGALADYKKAIELDPEDAIAMNNLGMLEEQMGYHKESKERFQVADELQGILNKNGIALPVNEADLVLPARPEKPVNKTEIPVSNPLKMPIEENEMTRGNVVSSVFTKNGFKEFIAFVRNGFKLGDKD
ncbi:MAG: tetratricopeptide (TPR) repeat protein [Flavobacteriales bacterium]|jgi:tetratricopeptide (TPR) repeat protein